MQNFINGLFIFATCIFIIATFIWAGCSLSTPNERDYGIGWLCGVAACLCAVAIYYCFATGIIPHG